MKKLAIISLLVFALQICKAQDSLRHFEFGSTLLTGNSPGTNYFHFADRPGFEFLNSLFFRYTKKRFALRAQAGYSDYTMLYDTPPDRPGGSHGNSQSKDFRIGLGVQYSLLKRKEWFYTFLDVSYRNVFSRGRYNSLSGAGQNFSNSANGFDSFLGLGFKIKAFKNVYLSPELGYFLSSKFAVQTIYGTSQAGSFRFSYWETNLSPTVKVHLTVKF